jgi:spore maturation protein CgeB
VKIVIFGLSISSSWGNGHATLWRGLCRALAARGHDIVFFEHDLPYYAAHRDVPELPFGELVVYPEWNGGTRARATQELSDADVAIVTSYCPDALAATELIGWSNALRVFYDLDTPVTLAQLAAGQSVPYIGERQLRDFELVLSYTGGQALTDLQSRLGALRAEPLYGSVDPEVHRPTPPALQYRAALSYLGTYAADRQGSLQKFLLTPALVRSDLRFVIGGAQYPEEFPWCPNLFFVQHLPPAEHPAFFSSSRLTLNVTRAAMATMGYCPSGRLFEAAACGVPVISDWWEGLNQFFEPDQEILLAHDSGDVLEALNLSDAELAQIGAASRERVLSEHTAGHRAVELEQLLESARRQPLAALANT